VARETMMLDVVVGFQQRYLAASRVLFVAFSL